MEEITSDLNERQKLFCELYCFDKDCFCSATKSYMKAYNLKDTQRAVAGQSGYRLLKNVQIKKYMNKELDKLYNNIEIDRHHTKLIFQGKNLLVSLGAIQEYNKIKKRIEEAPVGKIEFSWKDGRGKKSPTTAPKPSVDESKSSKDSRTPKGKFIIEVNQ